MILYIKKRDGKKVVFNPDKIQTAIKKAFVASNRKATDSLLVELTNHVVEALESKYAEPSTPSVEHTQDIVENVLLRNGHIEIAKAYILYRAKHKELRESQTLLDIKAEKLFVVTADGHEVPFRPGIILSKLRRLAASLPHVAVDSLVEEISRSVYSGMPLAEVDDQIVSIVKARIEKHYDYSYLASRMVLDRLYKDILKVEFGSDALDHAYEARFAAYIDRGVELELLSPELKKFDLAKLAGALKAGRDQEFLYLGMQTLTDRYFLRDRESRAEIELPQWMWMRVAMGLATLEKDREAAAIAFYDVLSQLLVVSSTPTLFNSGTCFSQMSSCYLNTVDDSMEGIFKNYSDNALLSKWAGGIGTDWTPVRAKGAAIKGTNGSSQGIIPFIKIFNDVALAVNQGGKRKGAMCAYLEIWHADVEEFLELKKNTGDERRRAHDIHTAMFIPDLFMKRLRNKEKWTLFTPDSVPGLHDAYGRKFEELYLSYEARRMPSARETEAVEIWKKLLTMLFETGHPWVTFKDPINIRSPQDHVGVVHNSNLCTEITLNTNDKETAVCNLASLNLARMVRDGKLDEPLIRSSVAVAMRMLDNVVDNNYYPIPEAKTSNMRHRPVGLGVMGYQDALYQLGIEFDSEDNLAFADRSMEVIAHSAIMASAQLAQERGFYETFPGSKWDRGLMPQDTLALLEQERGMAVAVSKHEDLDWTPVRQAVEKWGMRNSNCMAIAPTATISNIAGTVPCVEPSFRNIYMKENLSGNFVVINKYLIDALEARGLWNDDIITKIKINNGSVLGIDEVPAELQRRFKETFEIDAKWVIEAAARRGKWIDQSASTNIFIKTTSGRAVSELYQRAWELGLKTTYYLRTVAASQVTKVSVAEEAVKSALAEQPQPEVVEQEPEGPALKACSITDPDCEACQ